MTHTEERFDAAGLDKWTEEQSFEVTQERIAEYAAATNDPIPAHLAGTVAPPVFAIVPVFNALTEPALEVVPLNWFGFVVHGEQDFVFHRPIEPGDVLTSRAKMIGFEGKPNGSSGITLLETRNQNGDLVNEQYVTLFIRGKDTGEKAGAEAPGHRFPEELRSEEPVAVVKQHVDEDQTFRYGPAAGDPMPIHLDEEVAKDSGLPGIIAHGLCTMAFTSWAVLTEVGGSDVSRLQRLAVRFAKMVLPGQDLTTTIWRGKSENGVTTYHYETTVGDTVVVKDGLAEVRD
ncbi:dehydratase [Pseudonocardiaceae bacterium YIM PH 21723]|nr:dehydratase [Pseudonocardiaceae bacterium YIM PH 21723]